MNAGQIVGAVILILVFSVIVGSTVRMDGWAVAAAIWGFSILATALIAVGVFLVFGS